MTHFLPWTRVIPFVVVLAATASIAAAQPGRGPGRGGPGMPPGPPFERLLNLTEEQQAKAKALRQAEQEVAKPLFDMMKTHHEALQALLDDDDPSAEAVGTQVIAVHRVQKQLKELRDSYHEKFVALLTPEQQQTLKEFEANRPERGPGGPFGPPFGPPPMPR